MSDGPARPAKIPKKVKAHKELELGKNKWQDFGRKQSAAAGAKSRGVGGQGLLGAKKESMFRTPEGVVGARVGFTGSGQAMRKDGERRRYKYGGGGGGEGEE